MCGIVGLFLKNQSLQSDLGRLTSLMLRELCDRGPDSAGFAIYGAETTGATKICMVNRNGAVDWSAVARQLGAATGCGSRASRYGRGRGRSRSRTDASARW